MPVSSMRDPGGCPGGGTDMTVDEIYDRLLAAELGTPEAQPAPAEPMSPMAQVAPVFEPAYLAMFAPVAPVTPVTDAAAEPVAGTDGEPERPKGLARYRNAA